MVTVAGPLLIPHGCKGDDGQPPRTRRWWCPVCQSGIRLAKWIQRPRCGMETRPDGTVVLLGNVRVEHPPVEMFALDLDHAQDATETPGV